MNAHDQKHTHTIEMIEQFTPEEHRLLEPFVSNMDKPVFALTNLPEVVKGALFSRYSRSAKSLRRVLLDEFIRADEAGMADLLAALPKKQQTVVQTRKAEEFYERVLVGYGDDSVAELAGAHIALENISIIATKIVEDARIGLSPLEKSTRYVYFDNKQPDGTWRYLKEKTLMAADSSFAELYVQTCDHAFKTYADLIPKVSDFVMEQQPKDDQTSDRAYQSSVRAKTCDILRGLLPASTLTNMGFFGDGRAFEYLITKMYGNDMVEIKDLAASMQTELATVIPSFVKRANDKYGISMQNYMRKVESEMADICSAYSRTNDQTTHHHHAKPDDGYVKLVDYDKDGEKKIAIAALYAHSQKPMDDLTGIAESLNDQERATIIQRYINERENRRHKPGRAFEQCRYTFDISCNYGAYRDLHRHRVLTQQRQPLTPHLGYKLPKEIIQSGYENEFNDVMQQTANAYEQIAMKHVKEAQYAVPLAYNIRWYMTYNAREAYHMLELRSARQGHIDYREVAQKMFKEIHRVHPTIAAGMKFMDMDEYAFERLEAEKKIDKKLAEISKKYGSS